MTTFSKAVSVAVVKLRERTRQQASGLPVAMLHSLRVDLLALTPVQSDELALEVLPALLVVACWTGIVAEILRDLRSWVQDLLAEDVVLVQK